MSDSPIALSLHAMATRFEVLLHGADSVRLRAAGEEALGEIERLDAQLSLYRSGSELTAINAHAAEGSVKVEPRLFRLLLRCADLTRRSGGAFDVTIAPLMRAWGFAGGSGHPAKPSVVQTACEVVGFSRVRLDESDFTIRFDRPGVEIDLGAVGKGYALDCAAEILRENGITSALLHGGTSSIVAIGAPPDQPAWRVALRHPAGEPVRAESVDLRDGTLSVSAVHGKSFVDGGREFGHVLDPRTGRPAQSALAAAVVAPSAAVGDALSTALLVLGEPGLALLGREFPDCFGMVAVGEDGGWRG